MTRSGVLGDTSVHAFTALGLEWQLLFFMGIFTILGFALYFNRYKSIPKKEKEESIVSREFWMFMGAIILVFGGALILFTTSIPVYNKLFDFFGYLTGQDLEQLHRTAPVDPIAHYNRYQLWIAFCIGLLSGFTQFLRFKKESLGTAWMKLAQRIAMHALLAAAITYLLSFWIQLVQWQYALMLWAGLFTVVGNLEYLLNRKGGHSKALASVLSHVGFGLMLLGIIASGLNQKFISTNPFAMRELMDEFQDERFLKNVYLIKGEPLFMNGYWVTYQSDTLIGNRRTYDILFEKIDANRNVLEQFTLHPNVLYERDFEKVASANPDTRHYLLRDIFTHITSLPKQQMERKFAEEAEDSLRFVRYDLLPGDTAFTSKRMIIFDEWLHDPGTHDFESQAGDVAVGAAIRVYDMERDTHFSAKPFIILRGSLLYPLSEQLDPVTTRLRIHPDVFDQVLEDEALLNYQPMTIKRDQTVEFEGMTLKLTGFERDIEHPNYEPMEGDMVLAARMEVTDDTGMRVIHPMYILRQNTQFSIKDFDEESGLHIKFNKIDPVNEEMEFLLAKTDQSEKRLPLEIAENAPRSDYLVLEAIEFPGINFFWLGGILMLVGIFVGLYNRVKK